MANKVTIRSSHGRLQLRWTYCGERFTLSVGASDDDPLGWTAAELKAATIERDLILENFDPTLAKYKPQRYSDGITPLKLFELYSEHKMKRADPATGNIYQSLRTRLAELPLCHSRRSLTRKDCDAIVKHLLLSMSRDTVKHRLSRLKGCWDWGIREGLVKENPWEGVTVKTSPKQFRPFSLDEIQRIKAALRSSKHSYYCDYVDFLLGTGCRTGEVIGLLWRHVAPDFSSVWIGEIWTGGRTGQRKSVKCGKDRVVPLPPSVQQMLRRRAGDNPDPDGFVFTAAKGGPIWSRNFSRKVWKPLLKELGIPYRRPYTTRGTLVSHAIDQGLSPAEVSEVTGHRVETLHKYYHGAVRRPKLPDLFGSGDVGESNKKPPEGG